MSPEDLQNIFFLECDEALGQAETGLLDLAAGTHDSETVNAIFRAVHSIKGGAGAFGHGPLQAFAHNFENLLSLVRDGSRDADAALVRLLLTACDMLADHVASIRGNGPLPDDAAMRARLDLEAHSPPAASAPAASAPAASVHS
ncbi:Hpt domain-containing protein, partial [Sandarakinorhabdus sp.]|uniref:Hpt domain-containing protein n=1 Tax=Sandarakinorhabdus sp. TaxID=1916663 RepID=UPI00333E3492